jgi:host factor-I protein
MRDKLKLAGFPPRIPKVESSSQDLTGRSFERTQRRMEDDQMVNRKLIRPSLSELKEQAANKYATAQRKRVPPEQTFAENYYYLKQMSGKNPVVVKLVDGEEIRGIIEWYDKHCIKVNRTTEPNLLIPKHNIKYIFKENEVKGEND